MHRSVLMRKEVVIVILMMMMAVKLIVIFDRKTRFLHFKMMRLMLHFMIVLYAMKMYSLWQWWWWCLNWLWCLLFYEYAFKSPTDWSKQHKRDLFEQNRHLGRPWSKAITTSVMILSAFSSCFQTMSTISCAQRIRGFIVVRFLLKRVEREPLSLSLSNMIIIVRGTHGLQLKSIFLYSDLKQYIFFGPCRIAKIRKPSSIECCP